MASSRGVFCVSGLTQSQQRRQAAVYFHLFRQDGAAVGRAGVDGRRLQHGPAQSGDGLRRRRWMWSCDACNCPEALR